MSNCHYVVVQIHVSSFNTPPTPEETLMAVEDALQTTYLGEYIDTYLLNEPFSVACGIVNQ